MNPYDERQMVDYRYGEGGSDFGFLRVAGMVMILIGLLHVVAGVTAISDNGLYIIGRADIFNLGGLTWGWIQLISGIVLLVAGAGLFADATWARIPALIVAIGALLLNLAYLPHYVVWSIWMIGLSAILIWVLYTRLREPNTH